MEKAPTDSPGALSHVRVLELSRVLAGLWAAQVLADLGAEVIKVESPGGGDDTRSWGPPFISEPDHGSGDAAYFTSCNRNKQSVTIDFSTAEGADLVRRLAKRADVVIENFKLDGLAKYGLDYASLKHVNPRIIYCSITGFGQEGPYAHRPGYDFLIQAMGGLMSITGRPDGVPGGGPVKVGVAVCDLFAGMYAAVTVLAALAHRERSGEGQHIDCSLLDSQVTMLANQAANWLVSGVAPSRMGNNHPNVVPYRVYAVLDGHIVIACGNDGQFRRLCQVLDCEDLVDDVRFRCNSDRVTHRDVLDELLTRHLVGRSRAEVIAAFEAVNVPCGPINDLADVFADPHVRARDLEIRMTRADGATVPTVAFPARLSATPATYRVAPPALGADTNSVLREHLNLDDATIAHLRETGAI